MFLILAVYLLTVNINQNPLRQFPTLKGVTVTNVTPPACSGRL